MATASPVFSVSIAEPTTCESACSKLGPCAGAPAAGGLRTPLRLWAPIAETLSIIISSSKRSARRSGVLHQADRGAQHLGRLLGHLKIGLVAAVRLPHVRQFREHVDIRHLHHAVFIRRRVARIVLELEGS